MNNAQIKHMVDRFLGWRLPEPFRPDAGISYKRPEQMPESWPSPTGTNLFDATQADAMVRYMIDGLPAAPAPAADVTDEMVERACAAHAKATDYYVEFHAGLRSVSSDKMRLGMRAALEAVALPRAADVREAVLEEFLARIPGGQTCDPQEIADIVRSLKSALASRPAMDEARLRDVIVDGCNMGTRAKAESDLAEKAEAWRLLRQPSIATAKEHREIENREREARIRLAEAALLWLWHRNHAASSLDLTNVDADSGYHNWLEIQNITHTPEREQAFKEGWRILSDFIAGPEQKAVDWHIVSEAVHDAIDIDGVGARDLELSFAAHELLVIHRKSKALAAMRAVATGG